MTESAKMEWQHARTAFIHLRVRYSRNPVFFHRTSTGASQLEHLQKPANPRHEQRLRKGLALTTQEIAAAQRADGRYIPSYQRLGRYSKRR